MTDLTEELRAACLSHCQMPTRPDGPTQEELAVLSMHVHWRAAAEIDRLRQHAAAAWQPMESLYPPEKKPIPAWTAEAPPLVAANKLNELYLPEGPKP